MNSSHHPDVLLSICRSALNRRMDHPWELQLSSSHTTNAQVFVSSKGSKVSARLLRPAVSNIACPRNAEEPASSVSEPMPKRHRSRADASFQPASALAKNRDSSSPHILHSPSSSRRVHPVRRNRNVYTALRNVHAASNVKYNVIATVVECGFPYASRGPDYCTNLTLMQVLPGESPFFMKLTIFKDSHDKFPDVRSVGDILRIHRAKAYPAGGNLKLCASNRESSFTVFVVGTGANDSRTSRGVTVRTKSATIADYDESELLEMHARSVKAFESGDAAIMSEQYCRSAAEVIEELLSGRRIHRDYGDIIVRVVRVEYDQGIVTSFVVCDGTGDASWHPEIDAEAYIGALLRVQVQQGSQTYVNQVNRIGARPGDWIRLTNVYFPGMASFEGAPKAIPKYQICMNIDKSRLIRLDPRMACVKARETKIAERYASKRASTLQDAVPVSSQGSKGPAARANNQADDMHQVQHEDRCADRSQREQKTAVDPPPGILVAHMHAQYPNLVAKPIVATSVTSAAYDMPFTCLRRILRAAAVPASYRVHAKLVDYWPRNLEEACVAMQSVDEKAKESDKSDDEEEETIFLTQAPFEESDKDEDNEIKVDFQYLLVLRLEDRTGSLDCIVSGEEARAFFPGCPPCDLAMNNCTRDVIESKLAGLLKPESWIDACIVSYESEGSEQVHYKLHSTALRI